jgi:hypothetical protein
MKFDPSFCASLVFAAASSLLAADVVPDSDLPQPFDAALAQPLLDSSPFTRSLNLSDSLTLTGIAYVDGKPVATLLDRATKESFIVSEEPNALGWTLAGATPDPELRHTQVRIMVGPELVTVRYGDDQLAPEHARRNPGPGPSSMVSSVTTRYKSSSYLGENGRERYYALSDKSREKFKESMHKLIDKHPELTAEQRATYAEKYYARAAADDQKLAADASAKAAKAPKISKSGKVR